MSRPQRPSILNLLEGKPSLGNGERVRAEREREGGETEGGEGQAYRQTNKQTEEGE